MKNCPECGAKPMFKLSVAYLHDYGKCRVCDSKTISIQEAEKRRVDLIQRLEA